MKTALITFIGQWRARLRDTRARRWLRRAAQQAVYPLIALSVLLVALYTAAAVYLPTLAERKDELETFLSERTAHVIRIGRLSTFWDALSPGARLEEVQVQTATGRTAIRLSDLKISISPWPLLWGEVRIHRLHVVGPRLSFERLADGRYRIGGFEPLEAGSPEEGAAFFAWLFRQHVLEIENGELQWIDRLKGDAPLRVKQVQLRLQNDGDRHRLRFTGEFPRGLCQTCSLSAEIVGNPFVGETWSGEIFVHALGLDVDQFPAILRERLPDALRARGGVELWTEWEEGRPVSVRGSANVAGLQLPLPGFTRPVALREARAGVDWRMRGDGWRLALSDLVLALGDRRWSAGELRLDVAPDEQTLRAQYVNLTDITGWLVGLERSAQWPEFSRPVARWRALQPRGRLADVMIRVRGIDRDNPELVALEADADGLSTAAHDGLPGVENLTGRLVMRGDNGEFLLDSRSLRVTSPAHFRAPPPLGHASGRLSWSREDDHWLVKGRDVEVELAPGSARGSLTLRLPFDAAESPHLRLRAELRNADIAQAPQYYPLQLPAGIRRFLERSLRGGTVESGEVRLEGLLREFPFRDGRGTFEVKARVRDGVYRYLSEWEPVTRVQASVLVRGAELTVTGKGRIGMLDADGISVKAAFAAPGEAAGTVHIDGRVRGPLDETLRVLREVKTAPGTTWKAYLPSQLDGRGTGVLQLKIGVPLDEAPMRMSGEYRVRNASLRLRESGLSAEALAAQVSFDEQGVRSGDIEGRFLGGGFKASLRAPSTGDLQLTANGEVRASGMAGVLGEAIAARLSGAAAWQLDYGVRDGIPALTGEVDLPGLRSTLPSPLNRPRGLASTKLLVRTVSARRDRHVVALDAGGDLAGKLSFARDASGWRFDRGRLALNEAAVDLPAGTGLALRARVGVLDIDRWLPLRGAGGGGVGILSQVSADVDSLEMFNRGFGAATIELARGREGWAGTVFGQAASGQVLLAGDERLTRGELNFTRLDLPEKKGNSTDPDADPRDLPRVRLRVENFSIKGRPVGALDFEAEPMPMGWRIERANLTRPEGKLEVSGTWRVVAGEPRSSAQFRLNTSDAGKTLEAFGVPDQMRGGEADIRGRLEWPGTPMAVRAPLVSGNIEVISKNGRFLQLKQGAARLLGIFDLSSIGRYLLLDFSTIFGEGFAYERIGGTLMVESGDARTRDLIIKGPSAQIGLSGRVGIAAEDFDLVMAIDPQLSDTLTVGSWYFLGPQVAATVLAVQKLFKQQIAAGTRVVYVIRGSWKDPQVIKSSEGGNAASE